jgi:hypothetical protein
LLVALYGDEQLQNTMKISWTLLMMMDNFIIDTVNNIFDGDAITSCGDNSDSEDECMTSNGDENDK